MKRLPIVVISLSMIVLLSCSGGVSFETKEVSVDYAWVPEGMSVVNPPEKIGLYKELLYFVKDTPGQLEINFTKIDGTFVKMIPIPMGSGPGELRLAMSVVIYKDVIYVYERMLNKIVLYDMNGGFIDEFPVNADIGTSGAIAVMDGDLYFHGMFAKKLVRVNLEKGEVQKTLEYDNPVTDFAKLQGKELKRGNIHGDDDTASVYVGYYNEPYKIEQFTADLDLVKTFTRPLKEKYEKMVFTQFGAAGNLLIASLKTDEKYLYAGFGGGQKVTQVTGSVSIEGIRKDYYISVFDKESGEFLTEIRVKEIPELYGVSNIIGVDRTHIVLLFVDMGNTLDQVEMTGKDDSEQLQQLNIRNCVVIVENPVWK